MLAILGFLWGIGKEQETLSGVLKGQIWRADTASSQHKPAQPVSRKEILTSDGQKFNHLLTDSQPSCHSQVHGFLR
jgi:hypothetical protein